jgi:hypothetical protein
LLPFSSIFLYLFCSLSTASANKKAQRAWALPLTLFPSRFFPALYPRLFSASSPLVLHALCPHFFPALCPLVFAALCPLVFAALCPLNLAALCPLLFPSLIFLRGFCSLL